MRRQRPVASDGLNSLPMKTNTKTPSVVAPSSAAVGSGFTLGLDLGDRQHHVCILDSAGQVIRETSLPNTRPALTQLLVEFPHATVALEAGTHSPWISRYLTELGAQVLVATRASSTPSPAMSASATAAMPSCSPGWRGWTRRYCIPSSMAPPRPSMICSASNSAMPWCAPV